MNAIPNAMGAGLPRPTILLGAAAFFYLLLGALGLSFAIAPGYASPIFPATGFAVAVLLWAGRRAWPGIWLGSFLLNVGHSWLRGDLGWMPVLVAAGIACGAALQALVASMLVTREVGSGWKSMEQEGDIVRTLLLAGPAACLLSASVGVASLYLGGIIGDGEFLFSWWNWWSGDTLGVLIALPLVLALLFRADAPWRGRLTTQLPPMLTVLAVVAASFYTVSQWERAQHADAIRGHGEELAQQLEQRFIAHQEAFSALRRLLEVVPDMSYGQFEYFTRIALRDNPDIFALSINPLVLFEQRPAYERSMALRTGNPRFEITERDAQRKLVRAAARPEYVSVGYISPLEGNRPAVGYDINSEPIRNAAIQNARRSGAPAVTAPIRLVQENRQRVGVLVLHPAYRERILGVAATEEKNLAGFAVGVIKVDEMIEIATRKIAVPDLVFQVDDAGAPADKSTLYRSGDAPVARERHYDWETRLAIADRNWSLRVAPTEAYLRQQANWPALLVGAGGLALAALLQMLLLIVSGRTAIIQRRVAEQTAELKIQGDAIEDRNVQLDVLFSLSPDAFVAFAADGKIKFANPACQTLTGIRPEQIVGREEEFLEAELRRRCQTPDACAGLATLFGEIGATPPASTLVLKEPRHTVLSIVGVRSESAVVPRILYLHDISREAEVDRMKSEFLSHAAHELRSPMASILGFTELLLKREFGEEKRREMLGIVHQQAVAITGMLNELLDLARIESRAGKDFKLEEHDLSELAKQTVAGLLVPGDARRVEARLPTEGIFAKVDAEKYRQALTNVLSNAYKFSPGGGTIELEVVREEREGAAWAGVRVRDHGIGMKPEELARAGERFYRADGSGHIPGTGLGLALVKEIMQIHGGRVDIVSDYGKGTAVTLWLAELVAA